MPVTIFLSDVLRKILIIYETSETETNFMHQARPGTEFSSPPRQGMNDKNIMFYSTIRSTIFVFENRDYRLYKNNVILSNSTVMCLSIGTPKIINFPFVPNGRLIIFRCPKK